MHGNYFIENRDAARAPLWRIAGGDTDTLSAPKGHGCPDGIHPYHVLPQAHERGEAVELPELHEPEFILPYPQV